MFFVSLRSHTLGTLLLRDIRRSFRSCNFLSSSTTGQREPFSLKPGISPKRASSGEEAFHFLKDGSNVFVHGGAATPTHLLMTFYDYVMAKNLKNIKLYHIHTEGPYPFHEPAAQGRFRSNSLFTGSNCRNAIQNGRADYIPIFLSQIPSLFRRKIIQLDLALLNLTPPDEHNYCSLGPSIDIARAAIQNANHVVAQINDQLPVTQGDANIHFSNLDAVFYHSQPCYELPPRKPSAISDKIGSIIAENLIKDGATLQTGIGNIPDAVLAKLTNHRNLGVHTEMFSDGIADLVRIGAITNALKYHRPGKLVSSFVIGTKKVFDFLDKNPLVDMCDVSWVNSPEVISQNPQPVAINSCIEIDLTGQVVSDSFGPAIYSGFGGQVDFLRGAALSLDGEGKAILALPSVTNRGETKIVPYLKKGAGVVTTRAHVQYVVTEHGIAYLFGLSLRQRAHALIQIAHPDHRESLEKAAFELLKVMPSP